MFIFDNPKLKAGMALLVILTLGTVSSAVNAGEEAAQTAVTASFGQDCETTVIREVATARDSILVAIYSLTRRNITTALARAAKRGVAVTVKFDARQAELEAMKESLKFLEKNGIKCLPIKMSENAAAMHDKFMVIDRKRVLTGSYNYTVPATELNYENLVMIESVAIAGAYAKEFDRIVSR